MKNLITFALLLSSIGMALGQPGARKIWLDGNRLFINAPQRGVQVMNNTNTRQPESIGFIAIPGNVDMAVIGNVMYANHYDDLVAFDWQKYIEDSELVEMARFEGLFPQHKEEALAMGIGNIDINSTRSSFARGFNGMLCF